MSLLNKKFRSEASLEDVGLRRKKSKQNADGGTIVMIELGLDVPLTSKLRGRLDARLEAAMQSGEDGVSITKIDASETRVVAARFFGFQNYAKDAKPKLELGLAEHPQLNAGLRGISLNSEGDPVAHVKLSTQFTEELWAWCGRNYDEAAKTFTLEIAPMQGRADEGEPLLEEGEAAAQACPDHPDPNSLPWRPKPEASSNSTAP